MNELLTCIESKLRVQHPIGKVLQFSCKENTLRIEYENCLKLVVQENQFL